MAKEKTFTVTIKLKVAQTWIDDGFDPTSETRIEDIKEFFQETMLPFAVEGEIVADVKVK